MTTPLNASATTAGALFSASTFEVPPYQREYAWTEDEVTDLWTDLEQSLQEDSYFLGLVILTEKESHKYVVDGQQRLLTLTLLAAALYHEAIAGGRKALAERLQADFLRSIDYDTDETHPRVILTDTGDNETLKAILATTELDGPTADYDDSDSFSQRMVKAYAFLRQQLRTDLDSDPFRRLGVWTEFLTNRLYFAVFIHPDSGSAYRVFEVINTRGRELTTADLLKNYVLSQTALAERDARYTTWRQMVRQFGEDGANAFVQFIRHVVTLEAGHILPKDLYDFLARRTRSSRTPPSTSSLMEMLTERLALYVQMIDTSTSGPADAEVLGVFDAMNELGVIAARPMLLAISDLADQVDGMRQVLQLVVRRIVVGNLGTGNVERRFGETARRIHELRDWESALHDLRDLNPSEEEFVSQLKKRSYNKATLTFLRRSIVQSTQTPDRIGYLHHVRPRQAPHWAEFTDEDFTFWGSTIGNSFLAQSGRRPRDTATWLGFRSYLLSSAVAGEWVDDFETVQTWSEQEVASFGERLAREAGRVWYS
jgi:hypothetical protein